MLGLLVVLALGTVYCSQASLIYFPRAYPAGTVEAWKKEGDRRVIQYTTEDGQQQSYLQGKLSRPRNLWVVCGGNGTVALDWSDWLARQAPDGDAYLLVDFPGYGGNAGKPSPESIRRSLKNVVPLAAKEVGIDLSKDSDQLRFFGHSLGAAACLIAADEFSIQRGVLLTPFTSTMAMGRHMTGLPLESIISHRFDNMESLKRLSERGPGLVLILHGTDDEAIPFEMGKKLAESNPSVCRLVTLDGARHNTIPQTHPAELKNAIIEAGRK